MPSKSNSTAVSRKATHHYSTSAIGVKERPERDGARLGQASRPKRVEQPDSPTVRGMIHTSPPSGDMEEVTNEAK